MAHLMAHLMASKRIPCRVLRLLTLSLPDFIIVFMVFFPSPRLFYRFWFPPCPPPPPPKECDSGGWTGGASAARLGESAASW